ncbi:MAG: hypothetical protein J6T10_21530 [Methanobrevibacter sp.]|nr:hypothetical protein [Methanobrevibacter sp.]
MFFLYPKMFIPTDYDIPPTLYDIMNAIVNFNREEKVKIKDLPSYARSEIFDFDYPLTDNISKEEFETLILKKFMMRRIGYETVTAFKIALDTKLNEIMPMYNKMFDMLDGWDLFNNGENITRTVTDSRATNSNNSSSGTSTSDRRFSELPQNQLADVRNGTYVTDYNYDTSTDNIMGSNQVLDSGNLSETISRSPADKIRIYKEFIENKESIYSMIFKDLDKLFYGLVL